MTQKLNVSYYSFIAVVCKCSYHCIRTEEDRIKMTKAKTILWARVSHAALGISLDVNLLEMFYWGRKWRNRNKKKLQSSGIKALVLDQLTFNYSSQ